MIGPYLPWQYTLPLLAIAAEDMSATIHLSWLPEPPDILTIAVTTDLG